jgi:anti-sigma-K factor RskA
MSKRTMTHRELLENALLDALSLLDDEECEAFNEAFAAAPPHVQAQVRREQTRMSRAEALLPDVAPPSALRARVLERVRAEMERRQRAEAGVAHEALRLDDPDTISRLPEIAHRRKVAAVWRAVALGCAAAAIVFGVASVHLQALLQDFRSQEDALLSAIREKFGPEYLVDALVDAQTQRITLTSSSAEESTRAKAALWMNPDWRTAKLFGVNLPATEGSQYRLVVLDEHNQTVSVVAEFTFNGGLLNREVPVTVGLDAERLAIVPGGGVSANSVLLGASGVFGSH